MQNLLLIVEYAWKNPGVFLRDVEELRTNYIDVDNRYEITLRMILVILFCMIIRIIITAYS